MADIPKITIVPVDKRNKQDKKSAKILNEFFEKEQGRYKGVISSLVEKRMFLKVAYGLELESGFFDEVLEEVVKLDIERFKYG